MNYRDRRNIDRDRERELVERSEPRRIERNSLTI